MVKITSLMDDYWSWIKNDTGIRGINDWHEITTPFLDRHNDVIRIYAKSDGDSIQLTDDGYTINDLGISGWEVHTPKRREILESMLNGFGVKLEGKELRVKSPHREFEFIKDKHNFLQAILAVDNFFSLAHSQSSSLFFDDVQEWLNSIPVKSTRNMKHRSGVAIFYDWEEKAWYASKEYYFPNETPTKRYEDIIFGGGLRSKRFKIDSSQDKLRLWIDSYEQTCRSSVDESIPDFKKRISFLSFRLYYNDKIYDAARLLHYEKGKMFIDKNKVTRVQPTPETKSNFYPPFFMKKPGYILSTGLHEVQFSNLEELVPPGRW